MTVARQVVPGRTYLVTRRCAQRQMLLRPERAVEEIYMYCVAEAVQRYCVTLNGFLAMGNHHHMVARDEQGNFPAFLAHLHKIIAKAMNALRGRWENFWAAVQPNAVYLVDAYDRFAKLVYLLTNPVKAHLVEHADAWPGASSLQLNLHGGTRTLARPRAHFRENGKMPAEVELRVERPEGFETLTEDGWRIKLLSAVEAAENQARTERSATGLSVAGPDAVLRSSPLIVPSTVEPRRHLRPHIACADKERRERELTALLAFREARRGAMDRLHAGQANVVFPHGTFNIHRLVSDLQGPDPAADLCARCEGSLFENCSFSGTGEFANAALERVPSGTPARMATSSGR